MKWKAWQWWTDVKTLTYCIRWDFRYRENRNLKHVRDIWHELRSDWFHRGEFDPRSFDTVDDNESYDPYQDEG